MNLGAWVTQYPDAADDLFKSLASDIRVEQLEWAARHVGELDPKFWSLVAKVPPTTVPVIVEAWKITEPMPLQERSSTAVAAEAEATRAERKRGKSRAKRSLVVYSDISDSGDDSSHSDAPPRMAKRHQGDLHGFVVPDTAPIEYEDADTVNSTSSSSDVSEAGVVPGLDGLDRYYRTDMGRDGM